ncbi:MAG: hypothetical protein OXC40_00865 [Proteobacteria bacterium]|nr:hypothetical protein [Pseudomonadota bacterium]
MTAPTHPIMLSYETPLNILMIILVISILLLIILGAWLVVRLWRLKSTKSQHSILPADRIIQMKALSPDDIAAHNHELKEILKTYFGGHPVALTGQEWELWLFERQHLMGQGLDREIKEHFSQSDALLYQEHLSDSSLREKCCEVAIRLAQRIESQQGQGG